jgi:hypothetical protein
MSAIGCHSEEPFGKLRINSATKNPFVLEFAQEILRGVYPESIEGLRMTIRYFWMNTAYCDLIVGR